MERKANMGWWAVHSAEIPGYTISQGSESLYSVRKRHMRHRGVGPLTGSALRSESYSNQRVLMTWRRTDQSVAASANNTPTHSLSNWRPIGPSSSRILIALSRPGCKSDGG